MSSSSSKSSQARLREALTAGGPTAAKGPPQADGVLSVTPDTAEAIEWRSRKSVVDTIAATSSFLDDDDGPQTSELYGKFTWTLEKVGEGGKRELRSNVFEVGSFKWYLLVYPHGCDVANHLSLFLCVADYDKLLPGWSHFAQFTIAVVNQDPKKSKYSDTLHRFCKKEHDWGWKKFMELGKVLDGFTSGDTLMIKAQVQVIRDRPQLPFKCLDAQYRRELVRVYLANVEAIVRRFVEEQRDALQRLLEEGHGFRAFWRQLEPQRQRQLTTEPAAPLLKGMVKRFFNEKEVTSTLVMDALYCGAKLLEHAGRRRLQEDASSSGSSDNVFTGGDGGICEPAGVLIDAQRGAFFFAGDAVSVLERMLGDTIPPYLSDRQQGEVPLRTAQEGGEGSRDAIERGERRLADLGRRCVETYAASLIASTRLEAAYQEAVTLKRQEALLCEEEARQREEEARLAARAEAERERRAKKKERAKRKKEAERARLEAEEAERQQQEAARRQEQQRKHQEAEERRRQEEAEREQEQRRQRAAAKQAAEARRQQQEAARRAKQQQEATARQNQQQQQQPQQQQPMAAAEADQQQAEAAGQAHDGSAWLPAGSQDAASSRAAWAESAGRLAAAAGGYRLPGGASSSAGSLTPSSGPASRAATPDVASLAASALGRGGGAYTSTLADTATPAASSLLGEESSLLSASELGSELSAEDEVESLRRQLALMEARLASKDAQLAALQSRVSELEWRLGQAGSSSSSGSGTAAVSGGASAGSSRPQSAALIGGSSSAASRPASAASVVSPHHRSLSGDRLTPPSGAAGGSGGEAGINGHALHAASSAATPGLASGFALHSPPAGFLAAVGSAKAPGQQQQLAAAGPSREGSGGTLPAMNPAAQQFNPSSSGFALAKQHVMASDGSSGAANGGSNAAPKRTGYAAAAAGEPTGGPPGAAARTAGAANGTAGYRGAVLGANLSGATSALSVGGSSGNGHVAGSSRAAAASPMLTQQSVTSGSSSGRNSIDGMAGLLPNGSSAAAAAGANGELYTRPPAVVLPSDSAGAPSAAAAFGGQLAAGSVKQAAPAAEESPVFDDFAHMGLISDLLE